MSDQDLIMLVFMAGTIFVSLTGLSKTDRLWLQVFLGFVLIASIVGVVLVWTT